MTPSWYLLAYDVSAARRGRQVQREVRKHGIALLESLYLCQASAAQLQQQLAQLRQLAGPSAADVVAYRLHASQPMHVFGTARLPAGLHHLGLPPMQVHAASKRD